MSLPAGSKEAPLAVRRSPFRLGNAEMRLEILLLIVETIILALKWYLYLKG